jgi:hypothetical protein
VSDEEQDQQQPVRVFMKRSICQARKEGDKWKISGPCWSGEMEMDQETFEENFTII